jgi:hypothetical protein
VIPVPAELRIEPISPEQMQVLLPMIGAYQRFYEVEEIDEERNRAFFSRFLAPSEDGMLLGAGAASSWSATPASTGTSPRSSRPRRC